MSARVMRGQTAHLSYLFYCFFFKETFYFRICYFVILILLFLSLFSLFTGCFLSFPFYSSFLPSVSLNKHPERGFWITDGNKNKKDKNTWDQQKIERNLDLFILLRSCTVRSENRCALRLRYVDLVVNIEVAVEVLFRCNQLLNSGWSAIPVSV
jgi:hypothetical protein